MQKLSKSKSVYLRSIVLQRGKWVSWHNVYRTSLVSYWEAFFTDSRHNIQASLCWVMKRHNVMLPWWSCYSVNVWNIPDKSLNSCPGWSSMRNISLKCSSCWFPAGCCVADWGWFPSLAPPCQPDCHMLPPCAGNKHKIVDTNYQPIKLQNKGYNSSRKLKLKSRFKHSDDQQARRMTAHGNHHSISLGFSPQLLWYLTLGWQNLSSYTIKLFMKTMLHDMYAMAG